MVASRLAVGVVLWGGGCPWVRGAAPAEINRRLQCELLRDRPLFSEDAEVVAERLGLALTSRSTTETTWSQTKARFCGIAVPEIRLFGDAHGKVREVEVNLINKGDFFTPENLRRLAKGDAREVERDQKAVAAGEAPSRQTERSMERAFVSEFERRDAAVTQALTSLFGEPGKQTVVRGERERVRCWQADAVLFLLSTQEGEFAMLRLRPVQTAGATVRPQRLSDAEMKKRLRENVVTQKNGDVWVDNIPMVDQGDKGYCAVASAERLLKYYGVEVDSHELAKMARTDKFGGTSLAGLTKAVATIADRNRRVCKEVGGGTLSVELVAKYVSKGMPLLWSVFVSDEIEEQVAKRQVLRASAEPGRWKKALADEEKRTPKVRPDYSEGHTRLIVGVNLQTGEIAYSDTWGQGTRVWITEGEARQISFPVGGLVAIAP